MNDKTSIKVEVGPKLQSLNAALAQLPGQPHTLVFSDPVSFSATLLARTSPTFRLPAPAMLLTGLGGATRDALFEWLVGKTADTIVEGAGGAAPTGVIPSGPDEVVIINGSSLLPTLDPYAPYIGEVTYSNPRCCPEGALWKGIQLSIRFTVTDFSSDRLSVSSGITSIELSVHTDAGGNGKSSMQIFHTTWLGQPEQSSSKESLITPFVVVCIPCEYVRDGMINLSFTVTDGAGNIRIKRQNIPAPKGTEECCK